jgi:hypothetical protein
LIKARNTKLSLILVLAMLMTMFAGLGTASANTTTYSCLQVPYVSTASTVSSNQATLGTIVVDWDNITASDVYSHKAILVLPAGFSFVETTPGNYSSEVVATFTKGTGYAGDSITTNIISTKEAEIEISGQPAATEVRATIQLNGISVSDSASTGEAKVQFLNISGLFPQADVTIANVVGAGAASISVMETKTITGGDDAEIVFTVQESTSGAVKKGESKALTFKLPRGFSWVGTPAISNMTYGVLDESFTACTISSDKRTLEINRTGTQNDAIGRSLFKITAEVSVDETLASFGDVMVAVKGKNMVTPTEVKIGSFADFGYSITVTDPAKEILAGRSAADNATADEAQLSEFFIAENITGSLLNNRTIYMQLPDGVYWYDENLANQATSPVSAQTQLDNSIDVTTETGTMTLNITPVQNKPGLIKGTFDNIAAGSKDKIKIEAKVVVAVNFEGDVTIEFSGSQGINDTITVAKVVKPVTAKADVVDVKIGMQNQEAGDVTITEVQPGVLVDDEIGYVTVTAPSGVSFAKLPTVEVAEGDVLLGTHTLSTNADGTRNNVLRIPVRSSSDKASTLKVSDISYTLDRTVPEGDLKLSIGGDAIDRAGVVNRTTAASVVAANCVTPAPGETVGNGEFRIGSNIYYVGGVAKVMDVAPYIKDSRTYVPMRYLGEILGAEVVWDDAARTVTLTKGDTTVVFTIGSTTYTVNGEAKTADVAPEIANDRTMLPARFVAEAFGAVVGWDAATQTVLIQK